MNCNNVFNGWLFFCGASAFERVRSIDRRYLEWQYECIYSGLRAASA